MARCDRVEVLMSFEVVPITASVNVYLLKGEHPALVDTMSAKHRDKLIESIEKAGVAPRDIEYILITHDHDDHTGNLAEMKRLSGAVVIAGVADVPVIEGELEGHLDPSTFTGLQKLMYKMVSEKAIKAYEPVAVDRKVKDGDIIEELGINVVGTPGHTPGGMTYHDAEGRRAFMGDMVSNRLGRPGMPVLMASESLSEIFESQDKLAGMNLKTAYPGHGRVIAPDASSTIAKMTTVKKKKLANKLT